MIQVLKKIIFQDLIDCSFLKLSAIASFSSVQIGAFLLWKVLYTYGTFEKYNSFDLITLWSDL